MSKDFNDINQKTVSVFELSSEGHEIRKKIYRKKRIKIALISVALCILVVLSALFAVYTTTDLFKSKDVDGITIDSDSDGITRVKMVDKAAFNAVTNNDYSAFNGVDVSRLTNLQPFLIGYQVEVMDESVATIIGGKLYGLRPGITSGTVYTQDGKKIAEFPIEVLDKNNKLYYNVTFERPEGDDIVMPVISGRSLSMMNFVVPDLPSKRGYVPLEWELEGEKFFPSHIVEKDTIVTAKWQAIPVIMSAVPLITADYQEKTSFDLSKYAMSGSESYSFYSTTPLPSGMVLGSDGVLSGRPSEVKIEGVSVKPFTFEVTVEDKINATTATISLQLKVNPRAINLEFWGYTGLVYNGKEQNINAGITNLAPQDMGKVEAVLGYGANPPKFVNTYKASLLELSGERAYCYTIEGEFTKEFSIAPYQAEIRFKSGNINDQDFDFVYDSKPRAISAEVVDLFDGDECEVYLAYNKTDEERINVAEGLVAEVVSLSNPNYIVKENQVAQSFNIIPAELFVKVHPSVKIYGDADPVFSMEIEGAKHNIEGHSEASSLRSILSNHYKRVAGEDVGSYPVTVDFQSSSDIKLKNYNISVQSSPLQITKREVSILVNNIITKPYDGTPNVTTSLMFESFDTENSTGHKSGDDLYYKGTYIGTDGLPEINASNDYLDIIFTLTGTKAGNYNLVGSYKGTITKYIITDISGITVNDKIFDGTNRATAVFSQLDVSGKAVTLSGMNVEFDSANTGLREARITDINLSPEFSNNFVISGDAILNVVLTATIFPRAVFLSSDTIFSKIYDGEKGIKYGSYNFAPADEGSGIVDGTKLAFNGNYTLKNVGENIPLELSLTEGSNPNGNYELKGSYTGTITKREVYITGDIVKTYDGSQSLNKSQLSFRPADALTGVVIGDSLDFNGWFYDKNIGVHKDIFMELLGGAKDNYTLVFNEKGTINKAPLNISVKQGLNKVYNREIYSISILALQAMDGVTISGLQGEDKITGGIFRTLTGTVNRVGDSVFAQNMMLTSLEINGDSINNQNYQITYSANATIYPAIISVHHTGIAKIYDGEAIKVIDNFVIKGIKGDDNLYIESAESPEMKYVGSYNQNATLTFGGRDKDNYDLSNATIVSINATIYKKEIVIVEIANNAFDKVYDGSTKVLTLAKSQLDGVVIGDDVSFEGYYNDKNIGNKNIEFSLVGNDINNYILINGQKEGSITPRALPILGDMTKVYDGNRILDKSSLTYTAVEGDIVNLDKAKFATKNRGESLVTFTLSGEDSQNYLPVSVVGEILSRELTIDVGEGIEKIYDRTNIEIELSTLSLNLASGDLISGTRRTQNYKVGTPAFIAGDALAISDDQGNDMRENYNITIVSRQAVINPRPVTIAVSAVSKTFDKTVDVYVNLDYEGPIAGDDLFASYQTGEFDDINAGENKLVTVTGIELLGSDAANYALQNTTATTTATIYKRIIEAVYGIEAGDKVYDGTLQATLDTSMVRFMSSWSDLAGMYDYDLGVEITGEFVNANTGEREIKITSYALTGGDAINHRFDQMVEFSYSSTKKITANITPRKVYIDTQNSTLDKIYDGSHNILPQNFIFVEKSGDTGIVGVDIDSIKISSTSYYSHGAGVRYLGDNQTIGASQIVINLEGNSAGNYVLAVQEDLVGKINRKEVWISTVWGDADYNKVYDGEINVIKQDRLILEGVLEKDASYVDFIGAYKDKNVGENIAIDFRLVDLVQDVTTNYILTTPLAYGDITYYYLEVADIYSHNTPITMVYSGNSTYNGSFEKGIHYSLADGIDGESISYNVVSKNFNDVYVSTANVMRAVFRLEAGNEINKNYLLINEGVKSKEVTVTFAGQITQRETKVIVEATSKGTTYTFDEYNTAYIGSTDSFRLDFNFGPTPSGIYPEGNELVYELFDTKIDDSYEQTIFGDLVMYYDPQNPVVSSFSAYHIGTGGDRVFMIINNPENPIQYMEPTNPALMDAYHSVKLTFETSYIVVSAS